MSKAVAWGRASGSYALNLLQAVFGTRLIEGILYPMIPYHPDTRASILAKEDVLTCVVAFASGYAVYHLRWLRSSRWVWVAGVSWFAIQALPGLGSQDGTPSQFSGIECGNDPSGAACMKWFEVTLPLIRTVFYSLGALFSSWVMAEDVVSTTLPVR